MSGPAGSTAAVRSAIRTALQQHHLLGERVLVACSGGADSLALAVGAAFVVPRHAGVAGAVIVNHQLQADSAQTAATAQRQCLALGLSPVRVMPVRVSDTGSGVEQASREVRYAALTDEARRQGARAVLIGHTRNDQAEQVLLGLARGSGARSLSGMPSARLLQSPPHHDQPGTTPPTLLLRPLLRLSRQTTEGACVEAGLQAWRDPHNEDPRFARARARTLLAGWDRELGPGVIAALARSAELLRVDADTLDELSQTAYAGMGPVPWSVEALLAHPPGIRTRLLRRMAVEAGATPGSLSSTHVGGMHDLLVRWHGQGPVDLPGQVQVGRQSDRLWLRSSIPS
ncbi:MAG: tRNA lysidine(34) synthetase TilS [Ornithinimicrobium sp.]